MVFFEQLRLYANSLNALTHPLAIIDILIVALVFYWVLARIKETRALRILWGLAILGLVYLIASLLNLNTLLWILRGFFAVLVVAIPVVFQPELRKLLERIGRNQFWRTLLANRAERMHQKMLSEIAEATEALAKSKTGALIVLKQRDSLADYEETGVPLHSDVTNELLLTIFFPKSPLHDGAVIITDNQITAAAATLPLSEKQKSYTLGTRHRAAIGLAQETDALVLVVSEERGTISIAHGDKLIEEIPPDKVITVIKRLTNA